MSSAAHGDGFQPITPNPFIVGNPVRDPSMFFGREAEFQLVKRRFQPAMGGGLFVFCGERRSGKTSILFQILEGRLGEEFVPVLIDMQSMAIPDEAGFLSRISQEIARVVDPDGSKIHVPDFQVSNPAARFHEFIELVLRENPNRRPIILVDEYELLETKIESGTLSDEVIHIMAHLMEHYSVYLVFTGSQHIQDRRKEYWGRLLGRSDYKQISYLEREDALALIENPVEGRVKYDQEVLESILRLTAGQAFYTQGICQNLVDVLNEDRTNHATASELGEVVDRIVESPFPQMRFLWDGLARDEKFVLALLAEALTEESASVSNQELMALIKKRKYPVPLDRARMATTLEDLFAREFLTRTRDQPPKFAFRMDLWRLWIRRMHSVWQVFREEGISSKPKRSLWKSPVLRSFAGVAALLIALSFLINRGDEEAPPPLRPTIDPPVATAMAFLDLSIAQQNGKILVDGEDMGDRHKGLFEVDGELRLEMSAPGYASLDTIVAAGDSLVWRADLDPLLGGIHVETHARATVTVNGAPQAPNEDILGLEVPSEHEIIVSRDGYVTERKRVRVEHDTVTPVVVELRRTSYRVTIGSRPSGAEVAIEGHGTRESGAEWRLPPGNYRIRVAKEGYSTLEESLVLNGPPFERPITYTLEETPPGSLFIRGRELAIIYVEGRRVTPGETRSYGPAPRPAGTCDIRVDFTKAEGSVVATLEIRPGFQTVFDYTNERTEWRELSENR